MIIDSVPSTARLNLSYYYQFAIFNIPKDILYYSMPCCRVVETYKSERGRSRWPRSHPVGLTQSGHMTRRSIKPNPLQPFTITIKVKLRIQMRNSFDCGIYTPLTARLFRKFPEFSSNKIFRKLAADVIYSTRN